ncbi:MAG: phage tail tape measure protein [Desulfovibrionaceae bacterium]|nr:phage tail tape measure protein [Desulfovibrionaceae bacterium]
MGWEYEADTKWQAQELYCVDRLPFTRVAELTGVAETQVAALGAAFLSAGASPEVAATALKSFTTTLVKGTAMSKNQAAAFQSLGFSASAMAKSMQTDAQGTIFKVLQALADKPKELQMSLLTEMFGEEAIGAIAPLLQNMGNLSQAFELVGDASKYAGSMQAEFDTRSKTTQNALQLLSNKLNNLAISLGTIFLPVVAKAAVALGWLADALRFVVESPFGQWLVQASAALATAVVTLTAFAGALWLCSAAGALLGKALAPLKLALLGLGLPVWLLIAAIGLLYAAYKSNFGGIADTVNRWGRNISLVVRGVVAIFQNLTGSSSEIRWKLAKDLKEAGLVGFVTTLARIVYRVRTTFIGFSKALSKVFATIDVILVPARLAVAEFMLALEDLFGTFRGDEVTSASASWEAFGAALGDIAGGLLTILAQAFVGLVEGIKKFAIIIGYAVGWVSALCSGLFKLTGATSAANDSANPTSWGALGKMLGVVLATVLAVKVALLAYRGLVLTISAITKAWVAVQWLLNVAMNANPIGLVIIAVVALAAAAGWLIDNWESVRAWWASLLGGIVEAASEAWNSVLSGITGFGATFLVSVQNVWNNILAFFDGFNLFESGAKLFDTFKDGILSRAAAIKDVVSGALANVRNLLPFSDAKEGPLSTLTLSGTRLMTTLGEGVNAGAGSLLGSVSGALGTVGETVSGWWDGLWGKEAGQLPAMQGARIPDPPAFAPENENASDGKAQAQGRGGTTTWTLHIGNVTLPNVKDAQGFFDDLQNAALEYGDARA